MSLFRRQRMPQRAVAPALDGATGWLNSPPLSPDDLHGRVVMYDFWTYTCINWLRTLPYVRAWHEKYRDHGLVVIGVHTPEFTFERDIGNVRLAAESQRVEFPVVLDSDYEIWRAFDNHYWPAVYLADHRGVIRYEQFGEGRYADTEQAIQQLLLDAGVVDVGNDLSAVNGSGAEAPADWGELESAEAYLGYSRADGFASISDLRRDLLHDYDLPSVLPRHSWALAGRWTIRSDRIANDRPGGSIVTDFHARDLHLVMAPAKSGVAVPFRVSLDGHAPGDAHGLDVDSSGGGVLAQPRMYQLLRQPPPITDCTATIAFPDGNAEAFVATFG